MTDTMTLGSDILRGCAEIAAYLGINERRCYYLLSRGKLPARKEGARSYVTTRTALAQHYAIGPVQD